MSCHGNNNLNASKGLEQKFTSKRSSCSMYILSGAIGLFS